MLHYGVNQDFGKDWLNLYRRYERLLQALLKATRRHPEVGVYGQPALAWDALNKTIDGARTRGGRVNRNLRQYRQQLIELCNRWGLRCAWAPVWLHAHLLRATGLAPDLPLSPPAVWPEGRMRIDVPYSPTEKWKPVQARIVAEARRQRDAIREAYENAGFALRNVGPEQARHVDWLYLRICPQPALGRHLRWTEIATKANAKWRYVKRKVVALAAELGITLEPGRPGRPPTYPC